MIGKPKEQKKEENIGGIEEKKTKKQEIIKKEKLKRSKYSAENLYQRHFFRHKSHTDRTGNELGSQR